MSESNGNGLVPAYRQRLIPQGRYEFLLGEKTVLQKTFARFYNDPDLCDIRAELALQRVVLASAMARLKDEYKDDLAKIPLEFSAVITELNSSVAKLVLAVDAVQNRPAVAVTPNQIGAVVESLVLCVADACSELLPDDPSLRSRIMESVADRMEALVAV